MSYARQIHQVEPRTPDASKFAGEALGGDFDVRLRDRTALLDPVSAGKIQRERNSATQRRFLLLSRARATRVFDGSSAPCARTESSPANSREWGPILCSGSAPREGRHAGDVPSSARRPTACALDAPFVASAVDVRMDCASFRRTCAQESREPAVRGWTQTESRTASPASSIRFANASIHSRESADSAGASGWNDGRAMP